MKNFRHKHLECFGLALSVIFCASTVYYADQSARQQRMMYTQYENHLSTLLSSLNQLETSLEKAEYLPQSAMRQTLAADIWKESQLAASALSVLPIGDQRLEKVETYLSQVGDYAYYLLRSSVYQRANEEEWMTLGSLYENAASIMEEVNRLKESVDTGTAALIPSQQSKAQVSAGSSLNKLNEEFPEYASLIYDGPYSDHVSQRTPAALKNQRLLTKTEAAEKAAKLLDVSSDTLTAAYEAEGQIPSYGFSTENQSVTISKQGGLVLSMVNNRMIGTSALTPEQGIQKAEEFLKTLGLPQMTHSYYSLFEGILTINFHSFENNCIAYPDLIKIGIAMDDGSVVRLDTAGFAMNYHVRNTPVPAFALEDARTKIPEALQIKSENLVYIPTTGYREVLCWEFVCKTDKGRTVLLYVNSESGEIENLLLLLETENGLLTR